MPGSRPFVFTTTLPNQIGPKAGGWPDGTNVLYLKLISHSTGNTVNYGLHADSANYTLSTAADIRAFVVERANGVPVPLSQKRGPVGGVGNAGTLWPQKGLDVQMWYPGFVVYELDPTGNWEFCREAAAVSTDADPKNDEYVDLYQIPDPVPGANPVDESAIFQFDDFDPSQTWKGRCRIAFFSAQSPSRKGKPASSGMSIPDRFNLNIQLSQVDGSLLNLILDPDIQNTGIPPH